LEHYQSHFCCAAHCSEFISFWRWI